MADIKKPPSGRTHRLRCISALLVFVQLKERKFPPEPPSQELRRRREEISSGEPDFAFLPLAEGKRLEGKNCDNKEAKLTQLAQFLRRQAHRKTRSCRLLILREVMPVFEIE